jgi:hydrogenase expression/formation protein HypE
VVAPDCADVAIAVLRRAGCHDAAIIGEVHAEPRATVLSTTPFGGTRVIDMLVGDPLPRIC